MDDVHWPDVSDPDDDDDDDKLTEPLTQTSRTAERNDDTFLEWQLLGHTIFALSRRSYERMPLWMQRAAYDCMQVRKTD